MEWLTKEQIKWRNEWSKALRSGEYTQGYGELKKVDSAGNIYFCVIGVAVAVAQKLAPNTDPILVDPLYGLTQDQFDYYIAKNDKENVSFPELAKMIDRETRGRTPRELITVAAPVTLPTEVIDAVYEADEKAIEAVIQPMEVASVD